MRALFWRLIRPLVFLLDAELAHVLSSLFIKGARKLGPLPLRVLSGTPAESPHQPAPVFEKTFLNRVGLAAGFDKNAELLHALSDLGFGFAEIGTVTPKPQPGNERPRLFRDPKTRRVFNRMGFNNLGAALIAQKVERARPHLPPHFRVGVNLGKNKSTPNEEAAQDYARAARPFEGLADYLVINVSSPNTPGLRDLQSPEALQRILGAVLEVSSKWKEPPPILIKLAPEIDAAALEALLPALEARGASGFMLTNTLSGEYQDGDRPLSGGWSGTNLTSLALERLKTALSLTHKPIVSVGGIMTPEDAARRIHAGASLVQLYTGWIYGGPDFPARCARMLDTLILNP